MALQRDGPRAGRFDRPSWKEGERSAFGGLAEAAARARESRHSNPVFPLSRHGPAQSGTPSGNADRAVLYDVDDFLPGFTRSWRHLCSVRSFRAALEGMGVAIGHGRVGRGWVAKGGRVRKATVSCAESVNGVDRDPPESSCRGFAGPGLINRNAPEPCAKTLVQVPVPTSFRAWSVERGTACPERSSDVMTGGVPEGLSG